MAVTKEINIKVNTGDSQKELNKVSEGVKGIDKQTSGLTATLDKFTGGAITKLKGFTGALGGVSKGFKSVGVAIAASGIGLLVVVIGAIITSFKNSEKGQNRFAKLMAVIGSVTGNVIDVIASLGDFIIDLFSGDGEAMTSLKNFGKAIFDVIGLPIKNVIDTVKTLGKVIGALWDGDINKAFDELNNGVQAIKGNFNEAASAITSAKDALVGFGEEALREAKIAGNIADQRAKADKIDRDLIVERAEANRKIAKLRDIAARKDLYNLEQRKSALIEAGKINDAITEREILSAKIRRNAQIEENKLSGSTKDDLIAEENAKARVINLETQRLALAKRLGTELSSLNQQELAEQQAIIDAKLKARQEEIKGFSKESDSLELDSLKAKEEAKTDIIKKGLDERLLATKKALDAEAFYKEQVELLKEDLSNNTLNTLGKIAKEGSDLAKGLAIADIVREQVSSVSGIISNTALANAKAVAASPITLGQPFVTLNTISAGLGIAGGIAGAVKSIKSITSDAKTPSGGSAGSGGGGGGAPAPSFNLVEGTGSNQIADTIQNQDQPIKAFVVSGDVTSSQELDRNIIDNASL